jgi:hypothetical protein
VGDRYQELLGRVEIQKRAIESLKEREVQLFLFKNRMVAITSFFQPGKNVFLSDLRYLTGLLVSGVKLSELVWDDQGRLAVSLEADQVLSLTRFLDDLKVKSLDQSGFVLLNLSSINRSDDGHYLFDLIFDRHEKTSS